MKINVHNYEPYLIDYTEGNLSNAMRKQVEAFLLANPTIQQELDFFNSFKLKSPSTKPISINNLKSIPENHITTESDYFHELCIGNIEKENTTEENDLLQNLVQNNIKNRNTLNLYKRTKLLPKSVKYNEKILLKKVPFPHQVNDYNFEEYCIANFEGWLDQNGQQSLNDYLEQNKTKQSAFELGAKLKLTPDYNVKFNNKETLKKVQVFNDSNKKRLAYFSAIAAIAVFFFMIYNTYQLENQNNSTSQVILENQTKTEKIESVLSDLTIQKNILETTQSDESKMNFVTPTKKTTIKLTSKSIKKNKETLACIEPIKIFKIECSKCISYNETAKYFKTNIQNTSLANLGSQVSSEAPVSNNDELAWKLAQASISGINKLTNAEMVIKRNQTSEKTRIAFNSKYFSFSTPIKNK